MLLFLKAWMVSFSSEEDVIIFCGVNVFIFKGLDGIILSVQDIIFRGVNVLILKAWMVSFSSVEVFLIFHGVNVIIFKGLDVIIFECRG
jgi:hypothetical protein